MADIKTKQSKKGTIKTLNKNITGLQKTKDRMISAKEKVNNIGENETNSASGINAGTNYATGKVSTEMKNAPYQIVAVNRYAKNSVNRTKESIKEVNAGVKTIKKRSHAKKVAKQIVKGSKQASNTGKTIKTAERTGKNAIKTIQTTGKALTKSEKAIQLAKRTAYATRQMARKTAKSIRRAIRTTIRAIKAIINGVRLLILLLTGGFVIVVIIVVLICIIAMFVGSVFGVFFSSEYESTITVEDVEQTTTMSQLISDLNTEFMDKITTILNENDHVQYDITGSRADWADVLAVYVAKVAGGSDEVEMMTLDSDKISALKEIFWAMNEISYTTEEITEWQLNISLTHQSIDEVVTGYNLHITITNKTVDEMASSYNFTDAQKSQMSEFLSEDYASMWQSVIYGSAVGSSDIVAVALEQIGNVGGQTYWSWYGFDERVEWCACFVSWCANECGYISAGIIPKFASCESEGVAWFKACGLWQDVGYTPSPGDIIFFDWEQDGSSDHVGIVEKVEDGKVYTIEGNSSDSCKENSYDLNSTDIKGYGTPLY